MSHLSVVPQEIPNNYLDSNSQPMPLILNQFKFEVQKRLSGMELEVNILYQQKTTDISIYSPSCGSDFLLDVFEFLHKFGSIVNASIAVVDYILRETNIVGFRANNQSVWNT